MSTEIKSIDLTSLTRAAHVQYHELVDSEIATYEVAVLHLEVLAPPKRYRGSL